MLRMREIGLTLLEALIVLSVVIILTVMAVPSFIYFLQEHRLTLTAENMLYALQLARSEAIKRNTPVYVSFQTGDAWCYGINTGSACACATPSSCNLGTAAAPVPMQINLSTSNLPSNNFQFEGSRGVTNVSNASITLNLYGQTTSISLLVSTLGNIQLCSSIGGYAACP